MRQKSPQKYDIFISYRRQGGESTARILCERFTDMGYKVFFDVEHLRSGNFNTALYSVIEECSDFFLVLSPNALDRCANENDWVRNEVSHALRHGKNIVPILLRGFEFPQTLPPDIESVRFMNGLEASSEFFDAFVDKLHGFLTSVPPQKRKRAKSPLVEKTIPSFLALLVFCLVIAGSWIGYEQLRPKGFPRSQEEKNITSELLLAVGSMLADYNLAVSHEQRSLNECIEYLLSENPIALENALATIDHSIREIMKIDVARTTVSAGLNDKLDRLPIDKSSVGMLMTDYAALPNAIADNLRMVKFIINDSVFDVATKRKLVNLYLLENTLSARYPIYYANAITLPIDRAFLSDFLQSLTYFTALSYEGYTWAADEREIENQLTIYLNKFEDIAVELASVLGNQTVQYANEIESFRNDLSEMGLTRGEIDEIVSGIVHASKNTLEARLSIQEMKEQVFTMRSELQKKKDEARAKFAPDPADDEWLLWGKMLRFMSLQMPEDALACLSMYGDKVAESDANASAYIPAAESFVKNADRSGIDYGLLVMGYEPGKTSHEIYEIGDIILAHNGNRCLNVDSFMEFSVDAGDQITVLRYENDQPVISIKTVVPDQSKVLLGSLTEREEEESALLRTALDADQLWASMAQEVGAFRFQQAIDYAQMYQMKTRGTDANADLYVPIVVSFIRHISQSGINYGVIVAAAESDALQIGDIIIAVDGQQCLNSEVFAQISADADSMFTIMRRTDDTSFETMDVLARNNPALLVKNLNSEATA